MARYQSFTARAILFVAFLWFLWFMSFTVRAVFSPIMPLIEDEFGVAHARATSIFMFISGGYSISLFFSGAFARAFGYRKAILLSTIITWVVYFLIPAVRIFQLFYPLALVLGLAAGLYLPSVIPLITDYYDEKLWGKAIAVHGSGPSVGVFASPFIVLFILSFFQWRGVFVLLGLVMLVCTIIFFLTTDEVGIEKTKDSFLSAILKRRAFWIMGVVWIFSAGCNLGLYLVIPLYLVKELSIEMEHANAIFGISRFGGALFTILAGFLVDKFSLKKGTFLLMFFTGTFTMLLAVKNIAFVKVMLFIQATISPTVFALALVAVPRLFEKEERGQATGFIVTLAMIGTGLIPYLLGVSGDLLSFRFGIFVLGLVTMLCSGLVWLLKELD